MPSNPPARLLLAGLPGSGKTTLLAALFHLLRGEGQILTSMKVRQDPEPSVLEYLLEVEQAWLACQPMLHTVQSEPVDLRLHLERPDGAFDLDMPDVSGEAFDRLWSTGAWGDRLETFAADIDGVVLVVRSDAVVPPDVIEVLTEDDEEANADESEGGMPALTQEELDRIAEGAPTQTKLADLIEQLDALRGMVPTVVAITAWDVVEPLGVDPDEWLRLNLPMLSQVLLASAEKRPSRVFGVSAQGGDILKPEVQRQLSGISPPATRITVRDGNSVSHDLTLPMRWLLNPNR